MDGTTSGYSSALGDKITTKNKYARPSTIDNIKETIDDTSVRIYLNGRLHCGACSYYFQTKFYVRHDNILAWHTKKESLLSTRPLSLIPICRSTSSGFSLLHSHIYRHCVSASSHSWNVYGVLLYKNIVKENTNISLLRNEGFNSVRTVNKRLFFLHGWRKDQS